MVGLQEKETAPATGVPLPFRSLSKMNLNSNWLRVNKSCRCPKCDHPDWCLISRDGSAVICPRTDVGATRFIEGAGYLHRLEATLPPRRMLRRRVSIRRNGDRSDLATRLANSTVSVERLSILSRELCVSAESLRRLRVGWWPQERAWSWPMTDRTGRRVIGITRRSPDGTKRVVRGHRAGLYVPHDLPPSLRSEMLLISEGGSDTASGLDLGYWTIGRFSCTHGATMIAGLVRTRHPVQIVICSDAGNEIEKRGAASLASALLPYARSLRLISPPPPHKDLRHWMLGGATPGDLQAMIDAAEPRRLKIRSR